MEIPTAGVPSGRSKRARRLRIVVLAAALGAARLDGGAPPAAAGQASATSSEASLNQALESITSAFRSEQPEPLAALVPSGGKTFITLESVGGGTGYYSRDQVYFILKKVFSRYDTLKFVLRRQRTEPNGGDSGKQGEAPVLVNCTAVWSYHGHDGADKENQVHFLLCLKKGTWSLVEIREAL